MGHAQHCGTLSTFPTNLLEIVLHDLVLREWVLLRLLCTTMRRYMDDTFLRRLPVLDLSHHGTITGVGVWAEWRGESQKGWCRSAIPGAPLP